MKKATILLTVAAVAAGGAALAQQLSPGTQAAKEQLARQIGVDAGEYTYHDLVELQCQLSSVSKEAERAQILAGFQKAAPNLEHEISAERHGQLAASIGVDASEYTLEELALIKAVIDSEGCSVREAERMVSATEHSPASEEAKARLAQLLGVEVGDYTLNELAKMKFEQDSDD